MHAIPFGVRWCTHAEKVVTEKHPLFVGRPTKRRFHFREARRTRSFLSVKSTEKKRQSILVCTSWQTLNVGQLFYSCPKPGQSFIFCLQSSTSLFLGIKTSMSFVRVSNTATSFFFFMWAFLMGLPLRKPLSQVTDQQF